MNVRKKLYWKVVAITVLAVVSGAIAYPKSVVFLPKIEEKLVALKINLGLDLQGGIHLEYKADVSQIESSKQKDALTAAEAVIERRVNAFGVGEPVVQLSKAGMENRIIVELPGVKDIEQAKAMLKETPFLEFKKEAGPEVQQMFDQYNASAKQKAEGLLEQAKGGADFEALAKANSEDPGSKDKGGDLDFAKKGMFVPAFDKVLFDPNFKVGEVWPDLVESDYGWHIMKKVDERPVTDTPPAAADGSGVAMEVRAEHILIAKKSIEQYPDLKYASTGLTGQNLKSATVTFQSQGLGSPEVSLQFDGEGTKLFGQLTKDNVGKTIAIVLDKQIISAPRVQAEIPNGQAVITGSYTLDEAKKLVDGQVAQLNQCEENLKKELAELLQGRAELAAAVDRPALNRYERLYKSKGDMVVVGVQHGVCGGCHMKLPAQILVTCQGQQKIVSCTNCGRILYYTRDMALAVAG